MSIANSRFTESDVYIDYPFEDVLFRYEQGTRRFFRKFYGSSEELEVPFDNELLNAAIRGGEETDAGTYARGGGASKQG